MVEKALENREIADVLVAQRDFEFLYLVGHILHARAEIDDLLGDLPIDRFDLGLALEAEQSEVEH